MEFTVNEAELSKLLRAHNVKLPTPSLRSPYVRPAAKSTAGPDLAEY